MQNGTNRNIQNVLEETKTYLKNYLKKLPIVPILNLNGKKFLEALKKVEERDQIKELIENLEKIRNIFLDYEDEISALQEENNELTYEIERMEEECD